jgi:signal transduction histidine kinase/DNA-binding response OmpR family regulator
MDPISSQTLMVLVLAAATALVSAWLIVRQRRRLAQVLELLGARTRELEEEREICLRQKTELERQQEIAERALARVEEEAQKLQEVHQAQSRLFSQVSHEFRTPLTLILGPLEDLRDGLSGPLTEKASRDIRLAIRNSRRLLHLVNQLLDEAKIEAGRIEVRPRLADMAAFLESIARSFSYLAKQKQMSFRLSRPVGRFDVFFDRDVLDKVVTNLLSNAFKLTPSGGRVLLSVEPARPQRHDEPHQVRICVRDNGPGIPESEQEYIFKRFYRVDEGRHGHPGSGIGLSLVKELVELHGGTVRVQSQLGFGSQFLVTLPSGLDGQSAEDRGDTEGVVVEIAEGQGSAEPLVEQELEPSDRTTVLIADDHADLRAYVREHLEPEFRVVEAVDGEQALSAARRTLPDLVITDVVMPRMDGHQLCRTLAQDPELSFIPVILLTAQAATQKKIEGLETGAADFLVKPFEVRELLARVRNLIRDRKKLQVTSDRQLELHAEPLEVVSSDDEFLQRLRDTVEANLADEEFTVEALADGVNLSRGHLHRRLRELLNRSPSEVIRTMRLERAAQLLAGRAGSVSEIAYGIGFKSVSHFSKSFKEKFGCTPTQYASEKGECLDTDARLGPPS